MSFKVTVRVHGENRFVSNGMRYGTWEAAAQVGTDLSSRWAAVKEWKVEKSLDSINRKGKEEKNGV